jgi:hypothetical protein
MAPVSETISTSVEVDVEPDVVYGLVADISRMGGRSPECRRCEWVSGDRATPGARFKGWNHKGLLRWSTICEFEVADGHQLIFSVVDGAAGRRTRWRYTFEPSIRGTTVSETCEPLSLKRTALLSFVLQLLRGGGDRADQVRNDMDATLAELKREAEAIRVTP